MAFDPVKPLEGTLCDAAEMRRQLQGLHDEIAAVPAGPPGPPGPEGSMFGSVMMDAPYPVSGARFSDCSAESKIVV